MKNRFVIIFLLAIIISSCSADESKEISLDSTTDKIEKTLPTNPKTETDFGQIGDYKTMDEYYLDENGGKIWHGYRKNLYPTLSPKTVSFYEHGELKWTETYDEVGNVLTSSK
jgi:hypothetical protein